MTLENYNYRTNPLFLRNQFDKEGDGEHKIPNIPKAELVDSDFIGLLLLGFDRAKSDDTKYNDRMVHFFLYDYKFEGIWRNPDKYIEKLKPYKAVLSPDFSMYREMNPTMQLYNTFRNRFCGAYLASKGIKVIPTVSWGDENTFDFCFLGIPKGSTVAVSTYMVSEHGNHKDQKEFFLKGYNEMLKRIEPERIVCYNTPFPEMEGNIVFVDYDLSSWKYQDKDYTPSQYVKYITGELPLPSDCDIVIKRGYIPSQNEEKGMGSAYGGEWQPSPNKPDDTRFLGKPGEVKITTATNSKGISYERQTHIGKDGKADIERHFSYHDKPSAHSNPHDHKVDWSKGFPNLSKPINYRDGEAPSFKYYKIKENSMINNTSYSNPDYSFKTISEFKWAMSCGAEIQFVCKGKAYCVFAKLTRDDNSLEQMNICEACYEKNGKYYNILSDTEYDINNEFWANNIEEILDFEIEGEKIRDIITKVEVVDRTI